MRNRRALLLGAVVAAALMLGACAPTPTGSSGSGTTAATGQDAAPGADPLTIYATTGYLADAAANIAPDAHITTMVGPGGNPHTHQPSTRDIERIFDADVVLWNGLHLEAQMIDLLESLGERQVAVGEELPRELLLTVPEQDAAGQPLRDPHIWNSPEAWSLVVGIIAEHLARTDPAHAVEYRANAAAYQAEIAAAGAEAAALLGDVPDPRILISGHDAFAYFGKAFDLQVFATDFVSTEAALSAGELSGLAHLIASNEVPAIFQDNQANPQAITSLREAVRALGWQVRVSSNELYADSLGSTPGVNTYLGVFRHNTRAIATALGTKEQR